MQVLRYERFGRLPDTLSVRFAVPQRAGTLWAALHLLHSSFSLKTLECMYALALDSFHRLLRCAERQPEVLTALRLQV